MTGRDARKSKTRLASTFTCPNRLLASALKPNRLGPNSFYAISPRSSAEPRRLVEPLILRWGYCERGSGGRYGRAKGRGVLRVRSEILQRSRRYVRNQTLSPRHGRLKTVYCLEEEAQNRTTRPSSSSPTRSGYSLILYCERATIYDIISNKFVSTEGVLALCR